MKANTASTYAVFLILLVLGQEFCVARHPAPLNQDKRIEKREAKEESKALQPKSRQKRNYAVVLLAITLLSSAVTMGFEIWLKYSGCCKLNSYVKGACEKAKQLKGLRESWTTKTKQIDTLFLKVANLREDIIQHTFRLQEIYIDLEAITRNYENFVDKISPETHKKFQLKWAEIERELKKGNRTVAKWSLEQINFQFKSYFDSDVKTAFFGMSTFLTNVFSAVYTVSQAYYRRSYQSKMITKFGTGKNKLLLNRNLNQKSGRLLGLKDAGIKQYVKDTTKGKMEAKFGMSSKYASLYHAYNVIGTLWSLGSDAYRIYTNVKQCEDKAAKIIEQYDYWTKADREMDKVKADATKYFRELNDVAWKYVKGNLSEPNLIKSLQNAQKILNLGSTPRLQSASTKIGQYIISIKSVIEANQDQAVKLERDLIYGLMTLKLLTQCYNERLKLLGYVAMECKQGAGSLTYLYNQAKLIFIITRGNCLEVGVLKTTLAEMQKFIGGKAKKEKYNPDCILNNKDKQQQVCRDKNGGYSESKISSRSGLSIKQAQYLISICPPPKLDNITIGRVCRLKSGGFSIDDLHDFYPQYSRASLAAVTCPTCSSIGDGV